MLYLGVTIIILSLILIITPKLSEKNQKRLYLIFTILTMAGIFYRYGYSKTNGLTLNVLARQMLQVCNFNFVLLPLCLFKKNEVLRQYLFYFAMFGASTVFLSYANVLTTKQWNDPIVINFWLNHMFCVCASLTMFSSNYFTLRKDYIPKVFLTLFIYFTLSFIGNYYLVNYKDLPIESTFSFIYNPGGIPLFELFYKIIPYPYFYLYLNIPFLLIWFYSLEWLINRKKCNINK